MGLVSDETGRGTFVRAPLVPQRLAFDQQFASAGIVDRQLHAIGAHPE